MEEYYTTGREFLSVNHDTKQFTFRKIKGLDECVLISDNEMIEKRRTYLRNNEYRLQWGHIEKLILFDDELISIKKQKQFLGRLRIASGSIICKG